MAPSTAIGRDLPRRPLFAELQAAVEANPGSLDGVLALAAAFQARGELVEALALLEKAAQLDPGNLTALRNWAGALMAAGHAKQAEEVLRRALVRNPMSLPLMQDLAALCLELGQTDEAAKMFALVARRVPNGPSLIGLCDCCLLDRNWRDARDLAARWIGRADGKDLAGFVGQSLLTSGRLAEARECFQEIAHERPEDPRALLGLGDLAEVQREFDTAFAYHWAVYSNDRTNGKAALACLLDLLAAERYTDARRLFFSDRKSICSSWGHGSQYNSLAPEWDATSIRGRTILVHGAVGLGDTIQHSRFLRLLSEEGAEVILEVPTALVRLMTMQAGVDHVVRKFDPLPPIDFECDLRELFLLRDLPPAQFGLWVPYLFPAASDRHRWLRSSVSPSEMRVGAVWSCSGLFRRCPIWNRSMPLSELRPLSDLPNVRLCSLQVGPLACQLTSESWARDSVEPTPQVADLLDTAAIVSHLDVVVTVDTSVAHLGGALGKKTLVILPYGSSWRWGPRPEECLWYPTVRLFRQKKPGEWGTVIQEVRDALLRLVTGKDGEPTKSSEINIGAPA